MAKVTGRSNVGIGLALAWLAWSCSDEVKVLAPPGGESPAENGGQASSGDAAPMNPALLVAVYVAGVDDDRSIYIGALPDVPSGELDYSSFLEFGNVDVTTHAGSVFVWERDPATMTRFSVNTDLSLSQRETLSFSNYGLGGGGELVYASDTRAYILSPQLDTIVVWDPSQMQITGEIPVDLPAALHAPGLEPFAHKGQVVGDSVVWQIVAADFDTSRIHPGVALAMASATTDEPVRFIEDERCVGADGGYVDARGDYYVRAGGYWGLFAAYGDDAAASRTCVLRVRAGEEAFDPEYLVDMRELTGTYVNFPWFHVQGSQYLAQAWNPSVPIPELVDDYWLGAGLEPILVDIDSGRVTPYPDMDGAVMISSAEVVVDGVTYYTLSDQVLGADQVQVVELRPEGIVPRFSLPSLWAFARIR
jgi:hypothetical protein